MGGKGVRQSFLSKLTEHERSNRQVTSHSFGIPLDPPAFPASAHQLAHRYGAISCDLALPVVYCRGNHLPGRPATTAGIPIAYNDRMEKGLEWQLFIQIETSL